MARDRGPKKPARGPKKPPLTHFLCIPLVNPESRPQLEASMQRFKNAVVPSDSNDQSGADGTDAAEASSPNVHPKAVRPVGALHLTLNVMSLDNPKLQQAIDTLCALDIPQLLERPRSRTITESIASDRPDHMSDAGQGLSSLERPISPPATARSGEPLKVKLKGLQSMHAPQKTSILYIAPLDPTDRLYPFCQAVLEPFADQGLLVDNERPLKLHATVVNTIYAKGRQRRLLKRERVQQTPELAMSHNAPAEPGHAAGMDQPSQIEGEGRSSGHGPNANAPLKIDARGVLERFRDFVWAEDLILDRLAICEMGAKKMFDGDGKLVDEQYKEIACVNLL